MFRIFPLLFLLFTCLNPATARAEVIATFYSHDFGDHFPHAFVKLKGTVKPLRRLNSRLPDTTPSTVTISALNPASRARSTWTTC